MDKKKNIVKKIIVYLLVMTLCIPVTGTVAGTNKVQAKTVYLSLDWEWFYSENGDGTAELTGNGFWINEYLVIPEKIDGKLVTSIGESAFYGDSNLKSVTIPESVTNISDWAFAFCRNLNEITIPESVISIGKNVFRSCSSSFAIYAKAGSYAETYALKNNIQVKTDPDSSIPDETYKPLVTPVPSLSPEPVTTVKPTLLPEITSSPSPAPVITLKPTIKPELTPSSEPTAEPELTPSPEPTAKPTLTPTAEPMPSPEPTPSPEPVLNVEINTSVMDADAKGKFSSNKVDVSVTGVYSFKVDTGSKPWLRVCKKNASVSASNELWFSSDKKENTVSFYVFADENTSITPRKGEITVTAEGSSKTITKSIEVTQEASEAELTVSASKVTVNAKGVASISSIKVKTNKTGGFSVDNGGNSWIKIGNSSTASKARTELSYESDGTFYIFISENPLDKARTGNITITHENGETKETIEVSQEGAKAVLNVDSTSKTVDNNGLFYNNSIYVKTSKTGSFTVTVEDVDWLKISSKKTSLFSDGISTLTLDDDAYIYLLADKNTGSEREATIKITHQSGKLSKTITVKQLGKSSSYLLVDRESAYFDSPEEDVDGIINISADESTKWTVTSSEDWIKITKSNSLSAGQYASLEGTGKGGFYILVKENDTYEERSGYVTISAPGLESHEIYVEQAEKEVPPEVLLAEFSISVSKKNFKKGKTSKIKLNYPEGLYASDIQSVTFSSNKKKVATVDSKGVIKGIKKGKAVITVKVTLENGSSKTFKAKITVDKRKVKLSKFS